MGRANIKAMNDAELGEFLRARGLPSYRKRQLLHWLYERRAAALEDVTEFSMPLREALAREAYVFGLDLIERRVARDGTEKYLFGCEDGERIESVLIPEADRLTLCISSQAGCAMGCRFCLTAAGGLRRNLRAHEIVEQLVAAGRLICPGRPGRRITNVVFMGMGEPLMNLAEVSAALERITRLCGISGRRVTVSTCGLADGMLELPRAAPEVALAVSLNATTDSLRSRIMPVNRRYPLRALIDACRRYPLSPRRRITFEYVLLSGVNDSASDAKRLLKLLSGIPSKVNLIPFNEFEGAEFSRPSDGAVLAFQEVLIKGGLTAPLRKSKGADILAACGQLRGLTDSSLREQTRQA